MKVSIDPGSCQGHGRCYTAAPSVFTDDEEGYGRVIGGGEVPEENVAAARIGALSCPERAVTLAE